jgi:hypothetical protein
LLSNLVIRFDISLGGYGEEVNPDQRSAPPLVLSRLTKFSWDRAPSQAYIFFLFFTTPRLRELQLITHDIFSHKWQDGQTAHGVKISPSSFADQPLICFTIANSLSFRSNSSGGLRECFERMDFPSLQKLDIDLSLPRPRNMGEYRLLRHLTSSEIYESMRGRPVVRNLRTTEPCPSDRARVRAVNT